MNKKIINSLFVENTQIIIFVLAISGITSSNIVSDVLSLNSSYLSFFFRLVFSLYCLLLILVKKINGLIQLKHIKLFLLFFCFYLIRIVIDTTLFPKSLGFSIERYYLYTFGVIVIPSIAFNYRLTQSNQEKSFYIITLIFFLICIYSLIIFHFESVNGSLRLWGGKTIHPVTLGNVAVTNIIISLYFVNDKNSIKSKVFIYINIFTSLITLILTESRGPILSLLLVFILFQIVIANTVKKKYSLTIFIILFCLVFVLFFSEFDKRVIYTITHGGARIEIWKNTIKQIINNPIWGSSLEIDHINIYPHNILLESFLSLGIFGGTIFILLSSVFIKNGCSVLRLGSKNEKWIVLLFVQFLISSMFSNSLLTNNLFWYFGMLIMSINKEETNNNVGYLNV